jgi:outer membrane protein assembly factor BamD
MKRIFTPLLLLAFFCSIALAAARVTQTPEQLLKQGQEQYKARHWGKAKKSFQNLIETYPTSSMMADARYYKGMCLYQQQAYDDAIVEFRLVTSRYPASQWADDSQLQIGLCDLKKAPAIQLDQNMTKQALLDLYTVIDDYPDSDRLADVYAAIDQARNRLADKDFLIGKFYERRGNFKSAIIYLQSIVKDYDTFKNIADVYYHLAFCQGKAGQLDGARSNYQRVIDLYPESKAAAKARKELGKLPKPVAQEANG